MKTKKLIADTICLLLAIELFYEGVSKLFVLASYRAFLQHMPYVAPVSSVLFVLIPFVELGLAAGLAFSKRQGTMLLVTIGALILFVIWICCVYFVAHVVSWPFDGFWPRTIWLHKISLALVMSWLALIGAWLSSQGDKTSTPATENKNIFSH